MKFKFGFASEPALVSEGFRLLLLLLVSFGLPITNEQQVMFLALGSIVLTLITRANVTAQDTLHAAGLTQKGVSELAETNKVVTNKSVDDILDRDK